MLRRISMILAFLSLPAFSCGLCSSSSDEEQIRRLIDRAVELAEQHDVGGLQGLASDDLVVKPWGMRRSEFKRWLFMALRRYGNFSLRFPRPSIELDEQQGTALTSIYFLMVSGDQSLPDLEGLADQPEEWLDRAMQLTNLFKLTLGLTRYDDGWLVATAHFKRLKGLSFD